MSHTSGRPFDGETGLSTLNPLGEFLSETDVELQAARHARTWDELELVARGDAGAQAFGAGRSRSFGSAMVATVAVAAIVAGSLTGLMMRGGAMASGEPLVQPAVSRADSPLASVPVTPNGAGASMSVREQLPSRPSSRVPGGTRSNSANRPVALHRVSRVSTAGSPAVAAHPASRGNDAQALPVVAPARASLVLAPVAASATANPAIPTSVAPRDVKVTATASDPDGDALTYQWDAPIGRFANATERETVYTCPETPTTVALTVTVTDRHGGTAHDRLTVHCVDHR